MRARILLLLSLLLLALSLIVEVSADVYQNCATHPFAFPQLGLCCAIDTTAGKWTATWSGERYIISPWPGLFGGVKIMFRDSSGFYYEESMLPPSGTITLNYTGSGVWTYTRCQWQYAIATPFGPVFIFLNVEVRLYLGETPTPKTRTVGGVANCYLE